MSQRLSGVRLLAALIVPWLFLAIYLTLYSRFLLPRMLAGQGLAVCVGTLGVLVLLSFIAAAITFSRDVISGRYPAAS